MNRIIPNTSHTPTAASRYHALRAQIAYLRSPTRRDGPARGEAEDAALSLEAEADAMTEALYWDGAERAARVFTPLHIPIRSVNMIAS